MGWRERPTRLRALEQTRTARAELLAPRAYTKASTALKDLKDVVQRRSSAFRKQNERNRPSTRPNKDRAEQQDAKT
jgi:hypothetical protein